LVNFLGTVTEKGKASFIDVISNRSHNLKMISESEENLSKVIKESLLSVYQDKLKDELPKSINNLYLTISTAFVSKDKYKEISLLLEKEDLFGVLLQDADFIKGLSILGAITTVEKSIDNVREILKRYDIDLSQLIKKSTEIRSKNDFDTILHTEQVITALI
jgi:6-pyruvoyl-tetrahydropterin synthase